MATAKMIASFFILRDKAMDPMNRLAALMALEQEGKSLIGAVLVNMIRKSDAEIADLKGALAKRDQEGLETAQRLADLEASLKNRVIRPVYEAKLRRIDALTIELAEAQQQIAEMEKEANLHAIVLSKMTPYIQRQFKKIRQEIV